MPNMKFGLTSLNVPILLDEQTRKNKNKKNLLILKFKGSCGT